MMWLCLQFRKDYDVVGPNGLVIGTQSIKIYKKDHVAVRIQNVVDQGVNLGLLKKIIRRNTEFLMKIKNSGIDVPCRVAEILTRN